MDMKTHQKINHFPGMMELCRKDLLARNLNRMAKSFPKDYGFFPRTWCLPADYNDFQSYSRTKKRKTFICKPDTGSQGRGIFLARSAKDVPHGERLICQLYIARPFIIDGYKFDMRIYVLVTSCDPFHIFLYQEGLARFCTSQYCYPARRNMEDACMHLTNYAINKHSDNFVRDDNVGSKRKLSALTRLLEQMSCDVAKLWLDIEDLVIKALVSAHCVLSHSYHTCFPRHASLACFELLGFDVLLDHKLKPWLLEINHSPSFSTDSALDREVKDRLLYDTLVLVNLPACYRHRADRDKRSRTRSRLQVHKDRQDSDSSLRARSEQQAEEEAQRQQRTLRYEDGHLGGYRRIFPREGGEKYEQFLQHSSSLFQDTNASRARQRCTREQLQELHEKQQRSVAEWGGGGAQGESTGERRSKACKPSPCPLHHQNTRTNHSTNRGFMPHFLPKLPAVSECGLKEEEEEGCLQLLQDLDSSQQVDQMLEETPSCKHVNTAADTVTESHQHVSVMTSKLDLQRGDCGGPVAADVTVCKTPPPLPAQLQPHSPSQGQASSQPDPDPDPELDPDPCHRRAEAQTETSVQLQAQTVPSQQCSHHSNSASLQPQHHLSRHRAKAQLCPKPQYHPHPKFYPYRFRLDVRPQAGPCRTPRCPAAAGHQGQKASSKASIATPHKLSNRSRDLQPISDSVGRRRSLKHTWPLVDRRPRGAPFLVSCPLSQMYHSGNYSDLFIVSGPAPINRRPGPYPASLSNCTKISSSPLSLIGQDNVWIQPGKVLSPALFRLPQLAPLNAETSLDRFDWPNSQ